MKVKKYLRIGKPALKGSILVIFGILNSRIGIGVEIFTINLIYGTLAYLFLSLSGIIVTKILTMSRNSSNNNRSIIKRYIIISGVIFLVGFIFILLNLIFNTIVYYFNIPILIFTILIGIFWCLTTYFGTKSKKNRKLLNSIIVSLVFSMGILYGAFLNSIAFPFYIYFFFFSTIFLQLSRELMKDLEMINNIEEVPERLNRNSLLKVSLILDISAIFFLILPVFYISSYPLAYLVFIICSIIFIVFSGIFTLESILEKRISYQTSSILKVSILFMLFAFFISGG